MLNRVEKNVLKEEETATNKINMEEETSLESEDFFDSSEALSFSEQEEEEDKWTDALEGENVLWKVPRISSILAQAKKKSYLDGSILKYTIQKNIFTAENKVVQMCSDKNALYILDVSGRIYRRKNSGEVKKIELAHGESKFCPCKDMALLDGGVIVALRKTFPSFFIISTESNQIREVRVVKYKEKSELRKIRACTEGYILAGGTFVCIYDRSTHLVQTKIDLYEEVVDAVKEEDILYILTEMRIVRYSLVSRQQENVSEVIVHPETLSLCKEYLVCGSKGSLSFRDKKTLGQIKEMVNLSKVSQVEKMQDEDILVYNSPDIINGMRMYNTKTEKVITTFPPGKGLYRVTAFTKHNNTILFAENKTISSITLGK